MSDIPPAPSKSPILIIVLLAVVGAVLAAIGLIWAYFRTHHTPPSRRGGLGASGLYRAVLSHLVAGLIWG